MNRAVLVVCAALLLGISGCSRQQSDWEKTRAANTTDSYELFLKKYPAGEFTAQAQARVKELYEERDWQKARDADSPEAYQTFLKQYPEGKWTEEARIRVENFTLAQAPSNTSPSPIDADTGLKPATPTPAPAVKTTTPKPAAAPKPSPKAPASTATPPTKSAKVDAGSFGIQLGAFKSGADAANKHWADLDQHYADLFAGLSPKVVTSKGAAGTLYRLQVVNLTEKHARAICDGLKAKSQACVVVPPAARRST